MSGEHFGESTIWGEHYLSGELYLSGEHIFFVDEPIFLEGRALDVTVVLPKPENHTPSHPYPKIITPTAFLNFLILADVQFSYVFTQFFTSYALWRGGLNLFYKFTHFFVVQNPFSPLN